MKNLARLSLIFPVVILTMILVIGGCKKKEDPPPTPPPALVYVGSDQCQTCHVEIYSKFIESGHPYKLNKVINNSQPVIPFTTALGLQIPTPAGYSWSNITWLIGGYGWKARFIDANGFIMTEQDDTQYNLANGTQVAYNANDPMGTKKYNCGRCHTTGWVSVADGGSPKDGLPGMDGDFFAGGIQCEGCHGKGSTHVATQLAIDITLDATSAFCGTCHYRNADHTIAASGGFIKHHEQYDAWLTSGGHYASNIGCNTCHDVHSSTRYDDKAAGEGVQNSCQSCHSTYNADNHQAMQLECTTCHMAKATKSAIKNGKYVGDLPTHIFRINPSATYTQFSADGKLANPDGLSLAFACYSCHKDADGEGGDYSQKTMEQLSAKATNFHGTK
ncbi:MAG: hypothetical protein H8E51_01305 [Bacteroidetes bacterium]|nr:hypothetical protein [Bacteroidota bacterium]